MITNRRPFNILASLAPVLAVAFMAQAAPIGQAQTPPYAALKAFPKDMLISESGLVKAPMRQTAHSVSLPLPSADNSQSSNVLPLLPVRAFDEVAIEKALADLYSRWAPSRTTYAFYFTMMPQKIDIKTEAATHPPVANDQLTVLPHYNVPGFPNVGIQIERPSSILGCSPFLPTQPAWSKTGVNDSIFVWLDGFGVAVPARIAHISEADFVRGFVTRLVLGAYVSAAKNYEAAPPGLSTLSLDINAVKLDSGVFQQYTNPLTYPAYPTTGATPVNSFEDDVAAVADQNPIAPVSILAGWRAASELLGADDANHTLQRDAWRLLSYRFSWQQVGEMTGFTLNYLSGVAENSRIAAMVSSPSANLKADDFKDLVQNAGKDKAVTQAKAMVVSFGNLMTAEFYAVAQKNHGFFRAIFGPDLTPVLTKYANFIDGYREGVNDSLDDIYADIAQTAYGAGYNEGFKDGYAAGYAAGWKDGYAQGNADAWAQANIVIGNLEGQISSLQTQLNNANNSGGGSGFWNTILSTGIDIIGSFF